MPTRKFLLDETSRDRTIGTSYILSNEIDERFLGRDLFRFRVTSSIRNRIRFANSLCRPAREERINTGSPLNWGHSCLPTHTSISSQTMISSRIALSILLLVAPLAVVGQTGPGPCHPYPGAVAQDCLELIGSNLGNDTALACGSAGRTTLNFRLCSIVTKCASGQAAVEVDTMVRRSLTTIGTCALSDYGSISGYYNADDGSKTCYLYPTSENRC